MLGDFLNSVNQSKINLMKHSDAPDAAKKQYSPFMVNRCLSYHQDCVLLCNELNQISTAQFNVEPEQHYAFLLGVIPKKKRFARLAKASKPAEVIEALCQVFNYSRRRAEEAVDLLTEEDITLLMQKTEKGGQMTKPKQPKGK